MRMKPSILLAVLLCAGCAYAASWDEIRQCIEEKDPGWFERAEREYKPVECPPVVTNIEALAEILTNIDARVKDIGDRTWALNQPIAEQIDWMLEWAVQEAVDQTLEWVTTTNGARYLSETNDITRWVMSLGPAKDIAAKVTSDNRGMVTSINWPVITNTVVVTNCPEQQPRWMLPAYPVITNFPPTMPGTVPTNWPRIDWIGVPNVEIMPYNKQEAQ